jgi:hypothetical protein
VVVQGEDGQDLAAADRDSVDLAQAAAHRDFYLRDRMQLLLADVRQAVRHSAVAEATTVTRRAKKVR